MKDYKVDIDSANAEFERFAEEFEIETDVACMTEEERDTFASLKNTVIRAVRMGRLVFNDEGEPEYTLSKPVGDTTVIKFREARGSDKMQIDKAKKNENMKRFYLLMASVTNTPVNTFGQMRQRDAKVCEALTNLFTG